jgi:ankyrin repeat protein
MKGILKLAMHTIVYKRWQIWKKDAMDYLKLKNEKALVLQSASRMWKVQSQVLHYYAFRRRLIQLQTTARIRIAMRLLRTKQWQHWAAVHIQRIGRGYILRSTMTKKRVLDIHFCASNNKYERLEYYCKKYLNLTYIADESGNYAIHNAAKYAQKRALRCLLKYGHDPLSWNRDGFNALHLVVLSSGAQRDETFHFLLEYGVDIHILSLDYRSCLMLAVQNERVAIAKVCLENGLRPDDLNGYFSSCLQIACITGYEIMAKTLIDHGADVNLADAKGMHPLHNAAISGNLEIAKMLVINGANLNVYEYENGQTPFMLACSRGLKSMVDYFISEGANPHALDYAYRNAAFNAVESDVSEVIGSLREVDVNFDCADSEGNTPLHYAAELGHVNAARELIYCGASPTIQNLKGNQPSHIAAKFNKVPVLKLLIDYDDHIARMNYSHQTPLGMAKFSLSREAQLFLEDYIAKIEGPNGRNEFGDVWWDRNLDQAIGDWRVEVDYGNHRVYVNDKTGERSKNPPMLPYNTVRQAAVYAEVPHRKRVKKLEEENTVNLNTYNNELAAQEKEIERERKIYRNATIIQKYVRMKLAKMKAVRMRHADREFKILFKYLRRAIRVYRQWKSMMNARKLVKIQALYRGYSLRRHFYHLDGTFQYLWKEYMKRRLARSIWTLWRNFNLQKMKTISFLVLHGPKLMSEWEQVLDVCQRPIRTVGVYEEYYYPQNRVIKFYRNTVNGNITYHKPQSMCVLDANNHKVKTQLRTLGFTPSQLRLSIKVQALWRGYIVRNNYKFIVKATRLCLNSESLYLENPTSDRNLFNYALYTHVVVNDIEKARILYAEVLRRMQFKGPDIPQILYAYAIFSFVTHDQDFNDCYHYIEKGREAEYNNVNYIRKQNMKKQLQLTEQECLNVYKNIDISHGKVFKLADVGFFKYTASRNQTSMAWHNYAACRFLVYDDFPGSFDAFMNAIKCDPMNSRLVSNYWVMMRHFFKTQDEIEMVVNQRMQMKAIKAQNDINERIARVNMAKLRETSAKYIQVLVIQLTSLHFKMHDYLSHIHI